jgi:UDP-N-acetylmuramate: L-alanyl-gamma-D-glutamyl-meso-diaminopimelate ligase
MLVWILERAGRHPGFLIGGVPNDFGVSARPSASELFAIEADEYDTAFFDKRSKFVHYRARTAILNNLEFDHADIFPDLAAIETQLHHFVRMLPASARIIANGTDAALERVLARGCWSELERFDAADGWSSRRADGESFDVLWRGETAGRVGWTLNGDHNRANALAAIAAARHVGVDPRVATDALSWFGGVKRRMELRGIVHGVTLYDDFAHHPTAIRTTIAGLRRGVGGARILAVLEPRSNTMKLGVMKDALADSLAGAERVFCFTADLGWDAAAALAPLGNRVVCQPELGALVDAIAREARPGDHVLVMSNGGFGGIHQKLLDRLAQAPAR